MTADGVEIFAASEGVGQLLTRTYEPSAFHPTHEVREWNQMNIYFKTSGTVPWRFEWKLQHSDDRGTTWTDERTTVVSNNTATSVRAVCSLPGTTKIAVGLPESGFFRILVRRLGGGDDTRIRATASFESRTDPSSAPAVVRSPSRTNTLFPDPKRRRAADSLARPAPFRRWP